MAITRARGLPMGMAVLVLLMGCDTNSVFRQLSEARRLAADLLVEFTRASDAANRSEMKADRRLRGESALAS